MIISVSVNMWLRSSGFDSDHPSLRSRATYMLLMEVESKVPMSVSSQDWYVVWVEEIDENVENGFSTALGTAF